MGHPRGETTPQTLQRREQVVKLRTAGYTFRAIARALDLSTTRVYQLWSEEIALRERELSETVEHARRLYLMRGEEIIKRVWPKIDVPPGEPVDVDAVDTVLEVMGATARMFGLDKPPEIDAVGVAASELAGVLAQLGAEYVPQDRMESFLRDMNATAERAREACGARRRKRGRGRAGRGA